MTIEVTQPLIPLPNPKTAPLPVVYQEAVAAIERCWRIDECKNWADKALALASYARQSEDETLFNTSVRIQDRATRRVGELLQEIPPAHGANQNITDESDSKVLTRTDAAREAGLSERQQATAIRVARVPKEEFEAAVESDHPPSVTALAELGKKPSSAHQAALDQLAGRDPEDFAAATTFIGIAREFLLRSAEIDIVVANRGLNAEERLKLIADYTNCAAWIGAALEVMNGL